MVGQASSFVAYSLQFYHFYMFFCCQPGTVDLSYKYFSDSDIGVRNKKTEVRGWNNKDEYLSISDLRFWIADFRNRVNACDW